ncbi:MAG: penicillin-binding protein 1A, partial [Myxococcaceae bacterium]
KVEWETANKTEIAVFPLEDVFHEFAPYFTEEVRRYVKDRYGTSNLLNEGLRVYTTMESERQRAAQKAVLHNLLEVDKRQGFRGPVLQLKAAERPEFIAKMKKVMGDEKLEEGRLYVALVTGVSDDGMSADVQVGAFKGVLPLLGMRWARKVNPEGYYPASMIESVKRVLAPGDVITVRHVQLKDLAEDKEQYGMKYEKAIPEGATLFRLEQEPELQGALVSIDPHRQYLTAMVGGYDFDANEFNRAFQACRQPGSSYKPLVYSAALEQLEWTEAKMLVDSPVVMDTEDTEVRWKPQNFSENFLGDVTVRTALVNSLNIPAVKTFGSVGVKKMSAWAKQLGLSTPMNEDFSAALGSSCVYPYELAQVYATFDRLGNKRPTYFVRKVEDRYGRTLEDHTSFDDAWASLNDRIAGGYARLYEPGEQVMQPENGFVLVDLLRGVVKEGTGASAQKLGKPAAGKTGTTNDSFDAWFAGFTRDLVTVTWVGYDKNVHPLGRYETGGRASLPMWLAYMKDALAGRPQPEFAPPAGLEVVQLKIDSKTGKATTGGKNAVPMWFRKGTEPKDAPVEKGHIDPREVDIMNVE